MSQSIKIDPFGFREYDARWIYEKDINELGITNLGKGLGTQIKKHEIGSPLLVPPLDKTGVAGMNQRLLI